MFITGIGTGLGCALLKFDASKEELSKDEP